VIATFLHKGLEKLYLTGSKAGIQPHHAAKLARQLAQLDTAKVPNDMNVPGWDFHALVGELAGHYSVAVNGNWRLTFRFEGTNAILVNYQDYH
jgi:toxin HigB-1